MQSFLPRKAVIYSGRGFASASVTLSDSCHGHAFREVLGGADGTPTNIAKRRGVRDTTAAVNSLDYIKLTLRITTATTENVGLLQSTITCGSQRVEILDAIAIAIVDDTRVFAKRTSTSRPVETLSNQ
ncbi:unnamed protein product [Prorocentrum cordatum]|uniref:Uncharacterized protein n=1 Tax=Prorocentrum cordatum TaxID=2364126 RepID=A0ABN9WTD6_9DINO|nr:unnamed protein product [Polarella glacialis]